MSSADFENRRTPWSVQCNQRRPSGQRSSLQIINNFWENCSYFQSNLITQYTCIKIIAKGTMDPRVNFFHKNNWLTSKFSLRILTRLQLQNIDQTLSTTSSPSTTATLTTQRSFEWASSRARVTSAKFQRQESMQWVSEFCKMWNFKSQDSFDKRKGST